MKILQDGCYFSYLFAFCCMLKYLSKCWVNLAWFSYIRHFTKINTIYRIVEYCFQLCFERELLRLRNQCKTISSFTKYISEKSIFARTNQILFFNSQKLLSAIASLAPLYLMFLVLVMIII